VSWKRDLGATALHGACAKQSKYARFPFKSCCRKPRNNEGVKAPARQERLATVAQEAEVCTARGAATSS